MFAPTGLERIRYPVGTYVLDSDIQHVMPSVTEIKLVVATILLMAL